MKKCYNIANSKFNKEGKMEEFYPYTLTIHLLCAILFIGYLFVDVFVLGVVKRKILILTKVFLVLLGLK